MFKSDDFLSLLQRLGDLIDDDLAPSDDRVITLQLDDVQISLENPDQSAFIYFHAPIKTIGTSSSHVFMDALKSNLFGLPLTGSWLAFDAETDELVLCFAAPLETTTPDSVVSTISALASMTRDLRHGKHIDEPARDGAGEPAITEGDNFWITKA